MCCTCVRIKIGTLCIPRQVCLRIEYSSVRNCLLLRDKRRVDLFLSFVHAETESKARASFGKPLVFHLRYASQVLHARFPCLNPDNHRPLRLIQNITMSRARGTWYIYMVSGTTRGKSIGLRRRKKPNII